MISKKAIIILFLIFLISFSTHITIKTLININIQKKWVNIDQGNTLLIYFNNSEYFIGLSYSLAITFTIYAIILFVKRNGRNFLGAFSGMSITGFIYFGVCFLIGCCGSPMLPIYMSIFGSKFIGFTKPLVFIISLISIIIGVLIINSRFFGKNKDCCNDNKC